MQWLDLEPGKTAAVSGRRTRTHFEPVALDSVMGERHVARVQHLSKQAIKT